MKALIAIGVAASATLATATSLPASEDGGTVGASITWDGDPPEGKKLDISADKAKGCCPEGEEVDATDRTLVVSKDGGIADVVIMLSPKGGKVEVEIPKEPFIFDQMHCRFDPHVLVIPKGATVRYLNSDGISHNVHTISRKNPAFNENVTAGTHKDKVHEEAELIKVTCDVHPWMGGYVLVTDDPYFGVTDANGNLRMANVKPGTYKAEWWHETLGKGKFGDVEVTAGGTVKIAEKLKEGGGGGGRGRRRR